MARNRTVNEINIDVSAQDIAEQARVEENHRNYPKAARLFERAASLHEDCGTLALSGVLPLALGKQGMSSA